MADALAKHHAKQNTANDDGITRHPDPRFGQLPTQFSTLLKNLKHIYWSTIRQKGNQGKQACPTVSDDGIYFMDTHFYEQQPMIINDAVPEPTAKTTTTQRR